MIDITGLNIFYGNIHVLHNVSFRVEAGEIVTLIGANGAGKTTVLNAISRLLPVHSGQILFKGRSILKLQPHQTVLSGIAQVPEGRKIFANLTVMENLEMGAYTQSSKKHFQDELAVIFNSFPRLKERLHQTAGTLSGGEQQMLAMARNLMSKPQLILMDEPSMGLAPLLVQEIFATIKKINSSGTAILLVEQNAPMALSIAHRAYVLETGKVILQGCAKELLHNEELKKAYLGR